MGPENDSSFFNENELRIPSPRTRVGSLIYLNTCGKRLIEQETRFKLNTYRSAINHQEWYMSKKPSFEYICSLAGLIWATYSGGSAPWGNIVPIIDVSARDISRKRVSLREQKKSHTLIMKLCSVVANGISRLV
jgi:hypothetical protein